MRRKINLQKCQDIINHLQTPIGRNQYIYDIRQKLWPILFRLASSYRRNIIRNTRIAVVVGSFGKTTSTRSVCAALGTNFPRSEDNSFSTLARNIISIRHGIQHAVIEVGIGAPGQMADYAKMIRPDIVIVTSIGSEHNRTLRCLECTREEKSKMVQALSATGIAVLNGDDPNVLFMKGQTSARVITFGLNESNDVRADNIVNNWPNGTNFRLHAHGKSRNIHIRLIGKHMVYPILAAVAVAIVEGFNIDQVIPPLETLSPTPGRMQPIQLTNGAFLLRDDFKSPMETIEAALDALEQIPAERKIIILGDISEPPKQRNLAYRYIGQRVSQIVSSAILIGGSTNMEMYLRGLKYGILPLEQIVIVKEDILKAIRILSEKLNPKDIVLIKGRGTQRLERLSLSLMGHNVRCNIKYCNFKMRCSRCPMLERGWDGLRIPI